MDDGRPVRRLRAARCLLVLGLLLGAPGCQFLQNEFYYLDRAAPAPPAEAAGEAAAGGQ
jgi:hypothetical protein